MHPAALTALVVCVLTLANLALRLRVLPGWWDADGMHYAYLVFGDITDARGERGLRLLYRWLMETATAIGGEEYSSLTVLAALLGVAAVPLTYWAARKTQSPTVALWMAALVGVTPVLYHESVRPSGDGPLCAIGAILIGLAYDLRAPEHRVRLRAGVLIGLTAGTGIVFKELFVLTALPLGLWIVWQAVRKRLPWSVVVAAAAASVVPVVLDHLAVMDYTGGLSRVSAVSGRMDTVWDASQFGPRRFLFGPLPMLVTDVSEWGRLGVVLVTVAVAALPRWGRRTPALAVALGAVLAIWWMPVSLQGYSVLPADEARYLLGALPALALVLAPGHDEPEEVSPWDRRAWWAALAVGALIAIPLRTHPSALLTAALSLALLSNRVPLDREGRVVGLLATAVATTLGPDLGEGLRVVLLLGLVGGALLARRGLSEPQARLATVVLLVVWLIPVDASHRSVRTTVEQYQALQSEVGDAPDLRAPRHLERVLRTLAGGRGPGWTELTRWRSDEPGPPLTSGSVVVTFIGDEPTRVLLGPRADETRLFDRFAIFRVR